MLMPAKLDELIGEGRLVRVVDEMDNRLDKTPLKRRKPRWLDKMSSSFDCKILTQIEFDHPLGW
jgi:hypothetical protein